MSGVGLVSAPLTLKRYSVWYVDGFCDFYAYVQSVMPCLLHVAVY